MLKDYSTLLLWAHRASPRSLRITPQDGSRPSFHTPPLCRASPPPAARRRRGEDGWGERKAKPDEGIRAAPARRTFGERGVSFTAGAPWLESRWRGPSLPSALGNFLRHGKALSVPEGRKGPAGCVRSHSSSMCLHRGTLRLGKPYRSRLRSSSRLVPRHPLLQ